MKLYMRPKANASKRYATNAAKMASNVMRLLRKTTERMMPTHIINTKKCKTDSTSREIAFSSLLIGEKAAIDAISPVPHRIHTIFFKRAALLFTESVTNSEFKINNCIKIWTISLLPRIGNMIQNVARKRVSWRNLHFSNRGIKVFICFFQSFQNLSQVKCDEQLDFSLMLGSTKIGICGKYSIFAVSYMA